MRFFSLLTVLFFGLQAFAQDQQGYYIDNAGKRTEGYFKTTDFFDDTSLEFKNSLTEEFEKLDTKNINEYGIGTEFKFKKFNVKLDKSDNSEKKISRNKDPQWEQLTVFLNTILEGDATLYSYNSNYGIKYFYTVKGKISSPEQLIYKKYKPGETAIIENNQFRQQLFTTVNCGEKTIDNFSGLKYSKNSLVEVFKNYNECSGVTTSQYTNTSGKKTKFHITAFAGAYSTTFGIENITPSFDNTTGVGFGFGAEAALRTSSDKWEIFARLEYEKISAELSNNYPGGGSAVITEYFEIDTNVLNLFLGPRRIFRLNDTNELFVDLSVGISNPMGDVSRYSRISEGTLPGNVTKYNLSSTFFGNIGVGYTFKNKYGFDLRYETNRNMFGNEYGNLETKIGRIGLNVRYTF